MSTPPPGQQSHIVVVDDEPAARELVGDYLSMHGFKVTLCDGGSSLRALLATTRPDLIILDLNMPEEDGLSLIRYLKTVSNAPIIMLTATASSIDRVVGLEIGADDYLAKPCELRELLARTRSVLRRTRWSTVRPMERRLAAIVSSDLVGFSRMIQENEQATLSAVEALFAQLINPSVSQHHGTLFKMLGDGALAEFPSVVDAVEWAIAFQRLAATHPLTHLSIGTLTFRLGIAMGDIVVSQSDRFGEGVALAVRLQEVARPGFVTVSDFVYQLTRAKISVAFRDTGMHQLKNITLPMQAWEWCPEMDPTDPWQMPGTPGGAG